MSRVDAQRPSVYVERALAAAKLPCVAYVHETSETNLRWAGNTLTTNGEMASRTLTVTATAPVTGGTAIGTVSQEVADLGQVPALVAAAEAAARSGPASSDAIDPVVGPAQTDWDTGPEGTSIDALSQVATELGGAFEEAAARDIALYGFAEHIVTTSYLGSSTGLRRRAVQPAGRFELNGKSDAGGSAWIGRPTRTFTDVPVAPLLGELVTRLGWGERRIDLAPGRYETLLPPGPVADLMIYTYWTASAQDAEEGRNVFAAPGGDTTIGNRFSELPISLRSDPHYPGLESLPYVDFAASEDGTGWAFDAGLTIEPVHWLTEGVHTELIRNRARAERTGRRPTPPPSNLILESAAGAGGSLAEMIESTERGLLLTCLWYIREVDPERLLLTGLTRDGVYLVEDGEVVGAVNNFRFNESPVDLLGRISEVGATHPVLCREWNDFFKGTAMPPVRVPDFHMSTVSPAS